MAGRNIQIKPYLLEKLLEYISLRSQFLFRFIIALEETRHFQDTTSGWEEENFVAQQYLNATATLTILSVNELKLNIFAQITKRNSTETKIPNVTEKVVKAEPLYQTSKNQVLKQMPSIQMDVSNVTSQSLWSFCCPFCSSKGLTNGPTWET